MEKIRIVMGEHTNDYSGLYSWKLNEKQDAEVGDFAIVENKDSFSLIEVVAIAETNEKYERKIAHHSGGIYKNVAYVIPRMYLISEE